MLKSYNLLPAFKIWRFYIKIQISSFSYKKNHKILETLGQRSCKATSWSQVEVALLTQNTHGLKKAEAFPNQRTAQLMGKRLRVCTPGHKKGEMKELYPVLSTLYVLLSCPHLKGARS